MTLKSSPKSVRSIALILVILLLLSCNTLLPGEAEPTTAPATNTPAGKATEPADPTPTALPPPSSTLLPPTPTEMPPPTDTPEPAAAGPLRPVIDLSSLGDIGRILELRPDPANPGLLQLITDQGFATLAPDGDQAYFQPAYPGATVIGVDNGGFIWMFQEDGAAIYATDGLSDWAFGPESGWTPLENYNALAGAGIFYDYVSTVERAPGITGNLWLATDEDVRRFDGQQWTVFTPEMMGLEEAEPDILVEFNLGVFPGEPMVWLGVCHWIGPGPAGGQGMRWWDGLQWNGAGSPLDGQCVSAVRKSQGQAWFGAGGDLWHHDIISGAWESFTLPVPEEAVRIGYFTDLTLDPNGFPWPLAGLCGGASCFGGAARYRPAEDGQWQQAGAVSDVYLPQWLLFDGSGSPWLVTPQTIGRIEGSSEQETAMAQIDAAASDETGRLWLIGRTSEDNPLTLWEFQP